MNAIVEAKKMFVEKNLNFEEQLSWYLLHGVVISQPYQFLMAKPIRAGVGDDDWFPDKPDCWYIHCAVGKNSFQWFLSQAPYNLPKLAWRRVKDGENRLRVYNTNTFQRIAK